MRKLIRITRKLVKEGISNNAFECPIAKGIREFKPKAVVVSSWRRGLVWREGINFQDRTLPKNAKEFIKAFDKGMKVKPFNFYIDLP